MSEHVEETPEAEAPETAEATETEAWSGPSQDEWTQIQEHNKVLVEAVRELYGRGGEQQAYEPEVEEDDSDLDLGQMIQKYVDSRFSEISPVLEAQQSKMGQEVLDGIYSQAEEQLGEFDRKLAERISQSEFMGLGIDPRDPRAQQAAQWAAYEGAKMAAEIKQRERLAGAEEYKKSISADTFNDGSAAQGGIRAAKPDETMDDVIERWSGTMEV